MLNHLSVPTDNLYKFMTITGLLIIFIPIIFIFISIDKIENDLFKMHEETIDIKIPLENQTKITNQEKIQYEILNEKLSLRNNRSKEQTNNLQIIIYINIFTSILGAIISALGFTLWYNKTQKLQDKILKEKIKNTV